MTATTRLMRMVYAVVVAESPPSFCVTTAQAVAVGQMIASMNPSSTSLASVSGYNHSSAAQAANKPVCVSMSHRCQRRGFSAEGFTLQNATNSIMKSRVGCSISMKRSMLPFDSADNGRLLPMKYARTPDVMETGRVQFFRNRMIFNFPYFFLKTCVICCSLCSSLTSTPNFSCICSARCCALYTLRC